MAVAYQPFATSHCFVQERATGFEPVIFSLARRHSTTEPRPPVSAESQNRTGDTVIFSHVLYQLSYLGCKLFPPSASPIVHFGEILVKLRGFQEGG